MTHSNKKLGSIAIGILIILALILGITFLIKLSSKNSPVRVDRRVDPSQNIQIFGKNTPEYIDLSKYKTDKGEIKNVDTTIITTNNKDYKYANTTNNFKTFFGNDIKIQKEDSSITFQILTNLTLNDQDQSSNLNFKNSLTIKNRIVYSSVYKKDNANIDIAYNIQNDKLSEEVILNQYLGSPKISQNLKLNNVYSKIENKRINFYSQSTNKLLWFIPQPKMYEQKNQNIVSNDLEIQLEYIDSSTIKLTKIINPEGQKWLSDPNRQYPIVIDPDFQIDNADTAANWVSSDTTNFTVSQETTIKHEGTGSVKIVAVGTTGYWDSGCTTSYYTITGYSGCSSSACGGNCWSTDGSNCDGGCTNLSYTTGSVATGCASGVACGGNCWGIGGSCDGGCTASSRTSTNVYNTCTATACGGNCGTTTSCPTCDAGCTTGSYSGYGYYTGYCYGTPVVTRYTGSGSCSSSSCYKLTGGSSSYYTVSGCSNPYTYSTYTTCTWCPQAYSYTASSPMAKWAISGSCSGDGSGSCYKPTSSGAYHTGDAGCGSSHCPESTFYTYADSCTWIAQKYSYATTGSATSYNFSGSCVAGSGNCYKAGSTATYYTSGACGSSGCSSGSYYTGATTCSWIAQKYSYSLSGSSTTIYIPNGSVCNSDGSGNCYKPTGTGSGYTSGSSCGGSGCVWTSSYGSMPNCTWFSNSALNDTATVTKGATDLSNSKSITFWVYASRTGSYMRFQMGEAGSAEQTYDFTISSANTWEQKTWDITGIASGSRDGIQYFAFKNTDASSGFTLYFDDIQALAAAPNPPSVCVISESPTDTYLIPKWVDNSSDENGFQLERNTDAAGFLFLTNLAAGITGYQDNSISSGHTYAYRVRSYKTGVGSTDFSAYCTHPTLDLHTGNFKFDGVKMEGVKIN